MPPEIEGPRLMSASSNSMLCNPLWESFEGSMRKLGSPQSPAATWCRAAGHGMSSGFGGGSSTLAVAAATGRDGNGSGGGEGPAAVDSSAISKVEHWRHVQEQA